MNLTIFLCQGRQCWTASHFTQVRV